MLGRVCFLFALAALFVCPQDLTAQRAAVGVTGQVRDAEARPIAGATVVLVDVARDQQRYGDVAGTDGTFLIDGVRPGTYVVIASHIGYATVRRQVEVEGSLVQMMMDLPDRISAHPGVTITEKRARTHLNPVSFSNLSKEDLADRPSMKDLPFHLATTPSVTFYSENGNGIGYSTLRLRGFDQRRVAVSINGVPQNDPEVFDVFWVNFFDVQGAVDDVQVQRGAGGAVYGSTGIGGAVNIVAMPYRSEPFLSTEIGYGAFDTRRYTVTANSGLVRDRLIAFGRLSRLRSDGYRDWSWSKFWRFFGGVRWFGDRATLTVQAYGGPQRDGLAYSGIPKQANDATVIDEFGTTLDRKYNFSSFAGDVEKFHQPHFEVHHEWLPRKNLTVRQTAFWIKGEGYFDFDGTFRSADYLRLPETVVAGPDRGAPLYVAVPQASLLFRAALDQWQVGWQPRLRFESTHGESTIGGEARLHRSLRWGRIEEATEIPAALVGGDNDVRVYSVRGEKVIASIYGAHLARLGRVALQGDLLATYVRYRVYAEDFFGNAFSKAYFFVNPRVGLTVFPEEPFSLFGSVALANREPRLKSLYDGEEAGAGFTPQFELRADGSFDYNKPIVDNERLLDAELGATVSRPTIGATANVYLMLFDDEIVPSGGLDQFGVPRTGNADRTRHYGVETEVRLRPSRYLALTGNLSLSRARFVRFVEYGVDTNGVLALDRGGNPIAGFPERTANLSATFAKAGWTVSAFLRYAGKQYVDNSGATSVDGDSEDDLLVDAYALVDASVRYRFDTRSRWSGLELYADVNNVANQRVLLFGNVGVGGPQFFPYATRHVFAGLRYTLR